MSAEQSQDIGTVTAINGKKITVEIPKGGGCKSCEMHGLCGIDQNPIVLTFEANDTYAVGDRVTVSVSTSIKLLSILIVYLLPLIALFVSFIIARSYMSELGAIAVGFAGLGLSFLLVRFLDRKISKHIDFQLGEKIEDFIV
jgi:positive regulator of sigma E activity